MNTSLQQLAFAISLDTSPFCSMCISTISEFHCNRYSIPYSLAYDRQCIFSSVSCFQDLFNMHSSKAHAYVDRSLFRTCFVQLANVTQIGDRNLPEILEDFKERNLEQVLEQANNILLSEQRGEGGLPQDAKEKFVDGAWKFVAGNHFEASECFTY
jgi:hypothetical protein